MQCATLNCEALGAALSSLTAIKASEDAERDGATLKAAAVALSGPPPEDLTMLLVDGQQALEVAQRVQEEARAAKQHAVIAEIRRCTRLAPPLLDVNKIEAAITAGEEASIDTVTVGLARDALAAATRRDEAASRLARLNLAGAQGVADDGVNGASILEAIRTGSERGVAMTAVEAVHNVLRASERADAPRRAAGSLLQCLVSLPTLEIDVEATAKALASAVALSGRQLVNGVDLVSMAATTLKAAEAAQTARDAVGAELVTATARIGDESCRDGGVNEVGRLIAEARRAGVAPRLLEACEAKLAVGKGRVVTKPTVLEIKARAVEAAAARRAAAETRAAESIAALVVARDKSASLRDTVETAQRAATASVSAAVEADSKLTMAAEAAGGATSSTGDGPAEVVKSEEARRHIFLDVAARAEVRARSHCLTWKTCERGCIELQPLAHMIAASSTYGSSQRIRSCAP